ncbi:hypothetical protein SAMN05421504_101626 [Amycolatopsis xylanica]|uniref:Subtilisin inhibitor-like n=1 Tax=Amycolatopsis xylanica TaxID=589385 RepID=A0A1H2TNT3_9PSEU|nr:hypothetical protein [Amycolatopsis xylanica]SDW45492.1 hypothetical protein SAMN05421504_101626 [Amycolatopsis xylanica]
MSRVTVFCLLAASLALAGCGSDAATPPPAPSSPAAAAPPSGPAPSPAANPAAAGTQCGEVPAKDKQAKVTVRGGAVDCAQATQVVTEYFRKLTPAEAKSPQGPGPIAVGEWTCGSGPNDPVTTCSTEDDRQVEGTIA